MSYCVGLTGGIGSGKSTVASLFAELGVPVIDTDTISHQLTQPGGAAIPALQAIFGKEYIDAAGALDRAKMRQLVFADQTAKHKLENILHPLIFAQAKSQAESSPAPYILLVVPLLFETASFREWMNRTVTVDCAEATQLTRVTQRNGMNEQAARAIMAQQLSRSQRLLLTDDTIQNEGDLAALREQVHQLNRHYLDLAKRSN
jgi:dephospho-CoA kinase